MIARIALSLMLLASTNMRLPEVPGSSSVSQPPSIAVSVSMERNRTSLQTEANAVVNIRNISNGVIIETGDLADYRLHVAGETGEPSKTEWYKKLLAGVLQVTLPAVPRDVAPGQSVNRTFRLGAFYDLSVPGKYSVYLEVRDRSGAWLQTNRAMLEMLPSPQK